MKHDDVACEAWQARRFAYEFLRDAPRPNDIMTECAPHELIWGPESIGPEMRDAYYRHLFLCSRIWT